jgi:hypothetical protein
LRSSMLTRVRWMSSHLRCADTGSERSAGWRTVQQDVDAGCAWHFSMWVGSCALLLCGANCVVCCVVPKAHQAGCGALTSVAASPGAKVTPQGKQGLRQLCANLALQALKQDFGPLEGYDASKIAHPSHHLPGAVLKGFPMKPWALLNSRCDRRAHRTWACAL